MKEERRKKKGWREKPPWGRRGQTHLSACAVDHSC
jgi:hypothetical protein